MNHYETDIFQGFCYVGRTFLTNVKFFCGCLCDLHVAL
jgi:hypothetical protein